MTDRKTRKQHYVPQFYLKQWIDGTGGFYPIMIEEKYPPKLKIFNAKSDQSRFCYENYFYAQRTGVEDEMSQILEKKFAEIEALFSKELPIFEAKILEGKQITETDKYHMAECMIFLHFKGKKYLDQSKRMTEEVTKELFKRSIPYFSKDPKRKAMMDKLGITQEQYAEFINKAEYTIDFGNLQHLKIMDDMRGFSNILHAKYWKVFVSRRGEFITTDAPYLDMPVSKEFYGNSFLSREQSFVLSPRVMIVAFFPLNEGGKKLARKDISNDKAFIQQRNLHNLMNSIKFGFHKDRELLLELERLIMLVYRIKESDKMQKTR
jgi:hypothetical protein